MNSAVSEASTSIFVSETYHSAFFVEALPVPQQQQRRQKPVKRQAFELGLHSCSEIQAQQQMNWVQMWPENGFQHAPQHPMPWMTAAGPPDMTGQQLSAQSMSSAMHMQLHADASAANMLSNDYSNGTEAGSVPGAVLGLEPDAAAAARPAAANATPVASMPAPQHRLPKRRASAPHLTPAAQQRLVFKCVPHVGGPDCPCTTCLCARTDELCQRLVQQRSAQAANAVSATAFHSSRAAGNAAPMQPRASSQKWQQAQAAGLGQSPMSCKRRSFELPPAPKSRRSPEGRQSFDCPSNAGTALCPHQQPARGRSLFAGYAAASSPPMQQHTPPAAAGQCHLAPAGSGPLRGQFQVLSVSARPFENATDAYVAANAAAGQAGLECSMAAAGPALPEAGSGHSGFESEDEAAIDRELEQVLAQIAWPGQQSTSAQQQGRPQHMHHRSLPHTLQHVHVDEALQHQMTAQQATATRISNDAYVRAADLPAAAPTAQGMPQRCAPPQQQQHLHHQAGACIGDRAALPACPDLSGPLHGWSVEQSGPSFDHWGPCQVGDPDEVLIGCPGSPDLALLGDFLDTSPEEASLVDLLLS